MVFIVLEQTTEKLVYKMRGHDLCSLHPPKRKREEDGLLIRLKRFCGGSLGVKPARHVIKGDERSATLLTEEAKVYLARVARLCIVTPVKRAVAIVDKKVWIFRDSCEMELVATWKRMSREKHVGNNT